MADIYEIAGMSRRISDRDAEMVGSTAARWHVLSALSREAATVPLVARRLGQARQSVQRVVDDLVRSGDLRRIPNPDHARSPLFELTDQGGALLEQLWDNSVRGRDQMLESAGIDAEDLTAARDWLLKLRDALREDDRNHR